MRGAHVTVWKQSLPIVRIRLPEGFNLHINGIAGRAESAIKPSSASGAPRLPSTRDDVETARSVALSALNNDRFRIMLEQIAEPDAADAFLMMQAGSRNTSTDHRAVFSSYAENGGE
jgi:hypothetical protein